MWDWACSSWTDTSAIGKDLMPHYGSLAAMLNGMALAYWQSALPSVRACLGAGSSADTLLPARLIAASTSAFCIADCILCCREGEQCQWGTKTVSSKSFNVSILLELQNCGRNCLYPFCIYRCKQSLDFCSRIIFIQVVSPNFCIWRRASQHSLGLWTFAHEEYFWKKYWERWGLFISLLKPNKAYYLMLVFIADVRPSQDSILTLCRPIWINFRTSKLVCSVLMTAPNNLVNASVTCLTTYSFTETYRWLTLISRRVGSLTYREVILWRTSNLRGALQLFPGLVLDEIDLIHQTWHQTYARA